LAHPDWTATALVAVVLSAAVLVGGLSVAKPFYAIALVLGAGIVLLVAARIEALPLFLVFTMFVESVSLGPGLRIGRLAAVMALAVLAYYVLSQGRVDLMPSPLLLAAAAYGFWLILSVYWADDSGLVYQTTFQYLLAVVYMLTFAILVRSRRQLTAIFATFAVGSLVFGVLSFIAYLSSSHSYLSQEGAAVGLQGDHVYFAIYQVISLPAALALAAVERRPGRRAAFYAVAGVIVLSVVASLSRTGLVVLGVVALATLALPWRFFFRHPGQRLSYAFALVAGSAVAAFAGSAPFVARAQTILNFGSPGGDRGSGRIDLWRAALHGWHDHPWFGLGAGNFQGKALDLLQSTPGVDTTAQYVAAGRVVHNAYLEALTELGVVGFVLFLTVVGLTFWSLGRTWRLARAARDRALERFAVALLVSLLGFCVSMGFVSIELGKPLWIFIGLALALEVIRRRPAAAPAAAS
jgi:O-antigen ligase